MRKSLTLRLILTSAAWVVATLLVTAALLVVLFRGHIEQRYEELKGSVTNDNRLH